MTQLGEMIAIGFGGDDDWECPFDHKKKKLKEKDNVMPKGWGTNSSTTLGGKMGDKHLEPEPFTANGQQHMVHYNPHHLIPGNATWPKTDLQEWVEKGKSGHIKANYGYDVNGVYNGVSLPSALLWNRSGSKLAYASGAMEACSGTRQFHDSHGKYSEFVVKILDKIAAKLNDQIKKTDYPGCDKEDCAGKNTKGKPYDPPVHLLARLRGITQRLESYLVCQPSKWRMPIYTSKFALMYQKGLNAESARSEIRDADASSF